MHQRARLDFDRSKRIDIPEAVFCEPKSTHDCIAIVKEMIENADDAVIATRATQEQATLLKEMRPDSHDDSTFVWNPRAATDTVAAIVSAGTSDLTVAAECALTLEAMGHTTVPLTDVGVAGLHRLIEVLPQIEKTSVVVAIAGMEGALATVLAGLIAQPIIAVPTSTGYGTAFSGVTAQLSMLASCAPGISVVGIDNGYGAACAAHRILNLKNE